MAPAFTKKRRQEDDAARPKKKFKKVKQRTAYHSSSEDEDDESYGQPRASDAPRINSPAQEQAHENKQALARNVSKGKASSILKKPVSATKVKDKAAKKVADASDASDPSDAESIDEDEELQINTAINSIAQSDDFDDVELEDDEPDLASDADDDEEDDDSDSETSTTSSQAARTKKKRNDPDAFATSISKILGTKLSSSKRSDPVLSRSKSAAEANKALADEKLEQKARAQIRAERKQVSERGRVKDVLGLDTPDADTGAIMELEKRLKKTAQRGVVKLFNAVRAAQVKNEEALRQAKSEGVIGMQQRQEKANEMSKQGFLDLISSGGKKSVAAA